MKNLCKLHRGLSLKARFVPSLYLPVIAASLFGMGQLNSTFSQDSAAGKETDPAPAEKAEPKRVKPEKPEKTAPASPEAPQPKKTAPESHGSGQPVAHPADGKLESRPYLGVALSPVEQAVRDYLDLPFGFGVNVAHVVENSPADRAGLQAKDILLSFDGQRLTTMEHLQALTATYAANDEVELVFVRRGAEKKVTVTLGEAELLKLGVADTQPDVARRELQVVPNEKLRIPPVTVQVLPATKDGDVLATSEQVQERVAAYREQMQQWMQQPAATRGPAPTLRLNVHPGSEEHRAARRELLGQPDGKVEGASGKKASAEEDETPAAGPTSGASIRVGGGGSGIRVDSGSSIVIGPGASIRTTGSNGGQVKIATPNGSVVILSEEGKSVIEVFDAGGKSVHKGSWQPGQGMTDDMPKAAQEVLKDMNLQQLELLNIQVGPSGASSGNKVGKGEKKEEASN